MNSGPLVSVICLCHNQALFVKEAIESVWNQSYPNVELIAVDDGSTDESKSIIRSVIEGKAVQFVDLNRSIGNCSAFNRGFEKSTGDFIIDLAADDVLLPTRIAKGIEVFVENIGVAFSDAELIDEDGNTIGYHYQRDNSGRLEEQVPEGDVYQELIQRYFISPPTMMIQRKVLEELGGYDESLTYEDFDFWIRSSRNWHYRFQNEVLVKKRKVSDSLSERQFKWKTEHQNSTLKVCQKIKKLNSTGDENLALRKRCLYEIKQCVVQGNLSLIPAFFRLLF